MACHTRHRTWRNTARCLYPYARVRGEGRYAVILPSVRWMIELYPTRSAALPLWRRYRLLGAQIVVLTPHGQGRQP